MRKRTKRQNFLIRRQAIKTCIHLITRFWKIEKEVIHQYQPRCRLLLAEAELMLQPLLDHIAPRNFDVQKPVIPNLNPESVQSLVGCKIELRWEYRSIPGTNNHFLAPGLDLFLTYLHLWCATCTASAKRENCNLAKSSSFLNKIL